MFSARLGRVFVLSSKCELINSHISSHNSLEEFELKYVNAETLHVKLPILDKQKACMVFTQRETTSVGLVQVFVLST